MIENLKIGTALVGNEKYDKFVNEYANLKGTVTEKTANSVEVYIETVKAEGINCKQWFLYSDFVKKFRII